MDSIIINELTVFARHGVLAEEQSLGQKFVISVRMELPLWRAAQGHALEKTINYAEVCRKITAFEQEKPALLIETAAEELARYLLHEYERRVSRVSVSVKKPWAPIGLPLEAAEVSVSRGWHEVYIGLGSNMGDRREYIRQGIAALEAHPDIEVTAVSDLIETEPYGMTEQGKFINACAALRTICEPEELLEELLRAEQAAHRERLVHWGPRTLDMDMLLYDRAVINTERLNVPHPEMEKRLFVLQPLAQIAPWLRHPVSGRRITDLIEELAADAADTDIETGRGE